MASTDTHNTHPIMDDVVECEIRLEYLQIGKWIGLGSYGEVYHTDWNGISVISNESIKLRRSMRAITSII